MKTQMTSDSFTEKTPDTTMRVEMNGFAAASQIKNEHDHSFPVIHVDFKGRILYANRAAFPLLGEWNCIANEYLPEILISQYPGLLNLDADFELKMTARSCQFYIDVIGFRESGYIGLYGFMTVANSYETKINKTNLVLSV